MLTAKTIGTGGLGRFGNQLFTISGVIGIAIKSGQQYGFPKWVNKDNALFGDNPDEMDQYFVNPLPPVIESVFNDYGYFWGYKDIQLSNGNWSIDAHLQDPRFFEHCMPLIRETFRMKDEPEQNEYVAVHYRAGDYEKGINSYHPRQTKEYYEKAIAELPKDSRLLLFSDDHTEFMNLIKNINSGGIADVNIYKGNYIEDFRMMKRCKSFITANSSFSLMAAILGEHPQKQIICPSLWFGSSAGITFDGYPKEAIVI